MPTSTRSPHGVAAPRSRSELRAAAPRLGSHLLHPFTDPRQVHADGPHVFVRGEGIHVWDADGKRFLDGLAGLWCAALGYGRPELAEAAARQMRTLSYARSFFGQATPPLLALSNALAELAPPGLGVAFFASSGSEANDSIVRLVRRFWQIEGRPEKQVLLTREFAYHGSSVMAASLGGMAAMHAMSGIAPGVEHVLPPYWWRYGAGESPDAFGRRAADAVEERILAIGPERVAAFFGEPLQWAGGVLVPPASYWPRVQEICRRHDVLLVADEVITGFGRTGRWWGCETFGIERPDFMTLAKALTSGALPLSAVLVGQRVAERLEDGGLLAHGYTYSGHPVACAVALENLRILRDEGWIQRVAETTAPHFERRLREAFGGHPLVGEVRVSGLIGAVEFSPDPSARARFEPEGGFGARVLRAAAAHGVLLRAVRDSLCFCPPLIIDEQQVDELVGRARASLDDVVRSEGLSAT
jgi:putrescine aminotransferase